MYNDFPAHHRNVAASLIIHCVGVNSGSDTENQKNNTTLMRGIYLIEQAVESVRKRRFNGRNQLRGTTTTRFGEGGRHHLMKAWTLMIASESICRTML